MSVDFIGNGLEILIEAEDAPLNDWMALASWYSISKNLPAWLCNSRSIRNAQVMNVIQFNPAFYFNLTF